MFTVQRLAVRARLDDPQLTLDRARTQGQAGDVSWRRWVAEYERGEALIVRLDVEVVGYDGRSRVIQTSNRGVFVEKDVHPPKVEHQIAEMTSKDFAEISAKLKELGADLDIFELGEMYVHVELDPKLVQALADDGAERSARRGGPSGEAAISSQIGPAPQP